MTKRPQWFEEWRTNEFRHLQQDVSWIKWLVGFTLFALIAAAVANLFI